MSKYPQWTQDIVFATHDTALAMANHEAWHRFSDGSISMAKHHMLLKGGTGEWSKMVGESETYRMLFPQPEQKKAMKWIYAHAEYDDKHPVEALDVICKLLGPDPQSAQIEGVRRAIQKSYDLYLLALDTGMQAK